MLGCKGSCANDTENLPYLVIEQSCIPRSVQSNPDFIIV